MDSNDGVNSDVDNLGICLGKRLGRIEVSSVETVEQLVGLVERCGVVEEALVEEHVARENDEMRITCLEQMVSELLKLVSKKEEKRIEENMGVKKKLAKLEEEQLEAKKIFLELVENCQGMEEKVKEIGRINENLLMEVKDLQKEKETLMKTLISNSEFLNNTPTAPTPATSPTRLQSNHSSPSTSILSTTSDRQPSSTFGPLAKPTPQLVTFTRRGPPPVPLFQPMPPSPFSFYPPNYSQHPYYFPQYQDYTTGYPQYPPWAGKQ
eukprot:GFUD01019189.1.p1 GENE.GFUD01019189.1~~GFUD01019189.1.p1  ORF type:complete len:285 (+),score=92.67 GFUD01019189.1:59-856(+)